MLLNAKFLTMTGILVTVSILFFVQILLAAAVETPACTVADFRPEYGPCDPSDNTRTMTYVLRDEASHDTAPSCSLNAAVGGNSGGGIAALGQKKIPCTCTADEVEFEASIATNDGGGGTVHSVVDPHHPQFCNLETNRQEVTGYKKKDSATCTISETDLASLPKGDAMCACTEDHIGSAYSQCNAHGLQEAYSFWRRPCTPTDGDGTRLIPQEAAMIPCDLTCRPGEYLAAPMSHCTECPAGSYSHKGELYLPPYTEIPPHFVTYCYERHVVYNRWVQLPCEGWTASTDGSYLVAGPYPKLSNLQSIMTYTVDVLEQPASLSFDYWLNTEKDGDYLIVNANSHNLKYDSGDSQGWRHFSAVIPEEAHQCAWSVEGHCLHTNQLTPYLPTTFFHFVGSGDFTVNYEASFLPTQQLLVTREDECNNLEPQNLQGAILFAPVVNDDYPLRGGCSVTQMIRHAIRSKASALILYGHKGHINGTSSVVTGTLKIGQISYDAAMAINKTFTTPSMLTTEGVVDNVTITHEMSPGRRMVFQIGYVKDMYEDSGLDQVRLKNFKVNGLMKHASSCTLCPPGEGSVSGSEECRLCPANTKAPNAGTAYPCEACPLHTVSPEGSTQCIASQDCTLTDFIPVYSKCSSSPTNPSILTRTISYVFSGTEFCDPETFTVPAPAEIPCGTCDAGSYFSNASKTCVQCDDLLVPNADGSEGCHACNHGFAVVRVLSYKSFDRMNGTLPPLTSTHVDGETTQSGWTRHCDACIGHGWNFGVRDSAEQDDAVIHVGRAVLVGATATLTLYVETDGVSSVSFESFATMVTPSAGSAFTVQFNVQDAATNATLVQKTFSRFTDTKLSKFTSPTLFAGPKVLRWKYHNLGITTGSGDPEFGLKSLEIRGVTNGPGDVCSPCPAGYKCQGADPVACSPGTFSTPMQSTCLSCSEVSSARMLVSEGYAKPSCDPCPLGFFANDAATACVIPSCQWKPTYWSAVKNNEGAHYLEKTTGAGGGVGLSTVQIRSVNTARHISAYEYNLMHFNKLHHTTINGNSADGTKGTTNLPLYFRVCNVLSASDKLVGLAGETCGAPPTLKHPTPLPNFACVGSGDPTKGDPSVGLGATLNTSMLMDPAAPLEPTGLRVDIDYSSQAGGGVCPANPLLKLRTTILMYCDSTVESHLYTIGTHVGGCAYNVTLKSKHACPVCTNHSFVRVDSDCDESGYKTRTYSFGDAYGRVVTTRNCVGGDSLPAEHRVKCPYALVLSEGYNSAWAAITIILGLVVLLLAFAVYQWMKHRALYDRYSRLENVNGNNHHAGEMDTVDYDDHNEPSQETNGVTPTGSSGGAESHSHSTTETEKNKQEEVQEGENSKKEEPSSSEEEKK